MLLSCIKKDDELDYFQQIEAEIIANRCCHCCNLKYCIQGKLSADWLKRVRKERNYEKVRDRKGKDV